MTRSRLLLLGSLFALGCGGTAPPAADRPQPTLSVPTAAPPAPAPVAVEPAAKLPTFAEVAVETSPDDQLPPVDRTRAGVSTATLRERVQAEFDKAGLATAATVVTDAGPIRLKLRPDVAPNHVRNFVALARAGYFDGLVFEHVIRQQSDDGKIHVNLIEGGCPLGTGEPGRGHLGYWLRPEFSEQLRHQPGSVGACHGDTPASGTRFYVTTTDAPAMDGYFTIFAQVDAGLEIARKIGGAAVAPDSIRPVSPVVIRKVTIAY